MCVSSRLRPPYPGRRRSRSPRPAAWRGRQACRSSVEAALEGLKRAAAGRRSCSLSAPQALHQQSQLSRAQRSRTARDSPRDCSQGAGLPAREPAALGPRRAATTRTQHDAHERSQRTVAQSHRRAWPPVSPARREPPPTQSDTGRPASMPHIARPSPCARRNDSVCGAAPSAQISIG